MTRPSVVARDQDRKPRKVHTGPGRLPHWTPHRLSGVGMRAIRVLLVTAATMTVLASLGGAAVGSPPEPPTTMAALGDSITRGHNACGWFFDCLDRSWSTGESDKVDSHLQRMAASNPDLTGNVYNNARADATSADLIAQARQAVTQEADYVTVLVGAGDACRATTAEMTSAEEFGDNVTAALTVLAESETPRLLIASVPDLIRLWEIGHHSIDVRNTWMLSGACPTALSHPDSTDPDDENRRQTVAHRLDEYNVQLAAACEGYAGECVYDGGAVHDHAFTLDHISAWDYRHPNRSGQALLAEVTWSAMQRM